MDHIARHVNISDAYRLQRLVSVATLLKLFLAEMVIGKIQSRKLCQQTIAAIINQPFGKVKVDDTILFIKMDG